MVFLKYVLTLFKQEKDFSTEALETDKTPFIFVSLTASGTLDFKLNLKIYFNTSEGTIPSKEENILGLTRSKKPNRSES